MSDQPMKFRQKPVVIEAQELTPESSSEVARWCGGRVIKEAKASDPSDVYVGLDIPTLEGVMRANAGDWIIRGVNGEFYPCRDDIFRQTYEAVDES